MRAFIENFTIFFILGKVRIMRMGSIASTVFVRIFKKCENLNGKKIDKNQYFIPVKTSTFLTRFYCTPWKKTRIQCYTRASNNCTYRNYVQWYEYYLPFLSTKSLIVRVSVYHGVHMQSIHLFYVNAWIPNRGEGADPSVYVCR